LIALGLVAIFAAPAFADDMEGAADTSAPAATAPADTGDQVPQATAAHAKKGHHVAHTKAMRKRHAKKKKAAESAPSDDASGGAEAPSAN
jgi:hypothetical protein